MLWQMKILLLLIKAAKIVLIGGITLRNEKDGLLKRDF